MFLAWNLYLGRRGSNRTGTQEDPLGSGVQGGPVSGAQFAVCAVPVRQLFHLGDAKGISYSGAKFPEIEIQCRSEGPHPRNDDNGDEPCQDAVLVAVAPCSPVQNSLRLWLKARRPRDMFP